jgi:hypothetical protein
MDNYIVNAIIGMESIMVYTNNGILMVSHTENVGMIMVN